MAMTRETDKGLYDASANNKKAQDMQRRIAMIGEKSPVLSVSIHQNSYQQDASVHGPQVFIMKFCRRKEACRGSTKQPE